MKYGTVYCKTCYKMDYCWLYPLNTWDCSQVVTKCWKRENDYIVREFFFFWRNALFLKHIISNLVCLVRKKMSCLKLFNYLQIFFEHWIMFPALCWVPGIQKLITRDIYPLGAQFNGVLRGWAVHWYTFMAQHHGGGHR